MQEFASATITAESGSIDLAKWLSYFTTDFMGDMAFGGGFELMRDDGDKEGIWTMIESGMRWVTFFSLALMQARFSDTNRRKVYLILSTFPLACPSPSLYARLEQCI